MLVSRTLKKTAAVDETFVDGRGLLARWWESECRGIRIRTRIITHPAARHLRPCCRGGLRIARQVKWPIGGWARKGAMR